MNLLCSIDLREKMLVMYAVAHSPPRGEDLGRPELCLSHVNDVLAREDRSVFSYDITCFCNLLDTDKLSISSLTLSLFFSSHRTLDSLLNNEGKPSPLG